MVRRGGGENCHLTGKEEEELESSCLLSLNHSTLGNKSNCGLETGQETGPEDHVAIKATETVKS